MLQPERPWLAPPNFDSGYALTMFGSTYISEQTFSILNFRKTKHCSGLSDSYLVAILLASTTKMQGGIEKLASEMQSLKSH